MRILRNLIQNIEHRFKNLSYYDKTLAHLKVKVVEHKRNDKKLDLAIGYDSIIVHHTGNIPNRTIEDIYNVHVKKRKFATIGYHFVITRDGKIYYTRPLYFKGAHAKPNTNKIGIAFASNFNWEKVSSSAVHSYFELVKVLRHMYNIPRNNIIGHVQHQVRCLNQSLTSLKVKPWLTEDKIFKINSLKDFVQLKRYEYYRLKTLNLPQKIIKQAYYLKSCPGINFYGYLLYDKF